VISVPSLKRRNGNWTGHVLFRNCLLKHVIAGKKGPEDEGKDVSIYWMTVRK
jgi:hypothetical protein